MSILRIKKAAGTDTVQQGKIGQRGKIRQKIFFFPKLHSSSPVKVFGHLKINMYSRYLLKKIQIPGADDKLGQTLRTHVMQYNKKLG